MPSLWVISLSGQGFFPAISMERFGADKSNMQQESPSFEDDDNTESASPSSSALPTDGRSVDSTDVYDRLLRIENRIDAITFVTSMLFFWWGPSSLVPPILWAYMLVRQVIIRKSRHLDGQKALFLKGLLVAVFAAATFFFVSGEAATFLLFIIIVRTGSFGRPVTFALSPNNPLNGRKR
jgi:hypothetical protein